MLRGIRTHSRDASSLACLVETLIVGGGKGWAPAFDSRVCPGRTVALHITVLLHSGVLSPSQSLGTPALLTQLWLATRPLLILSLAHLTAHGPRVFPRVCGFFSAAGGLALSSTSRHLISSAFLWQQSLAFPGGTCGDMRDVCFFSSGRLGMMSRLRSQHGFCLHW